MGRNPVSRRTGQSTSHISEEQAKRQLLDLRSKLTKDNFAQYAAQWSDCGSFQEGGDLGVFKKGDMMDAFWVGTIALQVGEISNIIVTDSGAHLILRTA